MNYYLSCLFVSVLLPFVYTQLGPPTVNDIVDLEFEIGATTPGFPDVLSRFDEFGTSSVHIQNNIVAVGAHLADDPESSGCECDRGLADGTCEAFRVNCNRGRIFIFRVNQNGYDTTFPLRTISAGEAGFAFNLTGLTGNETARIGAEFGSALDSADFNGDGIMDLLVGAPGQLTPGGQELGTSFILILDSDYQVSQIHEIGPATVPNLESALVPDPVDMRGPEFGTGVAFLSDLDGNGVLDIAIGARFQSDDCVACGTVFVIFLEANGTASSFTRISSANLTTPLGSSQEFGKALVAVDLDRDNVTELIVGSPNADGNCTTATPNCRRGQARIFWLNPDGSIKRDFDFLISDGDIGLVPLDDDDRFGDDISCIDVNGDGRLEIAVGAVRDDDGGNNRGSFYIVGFDANYTNILNYYKISQNFGIQTPLSSGDRFGQSITVVQDINNDGINDILVGSPDDDGGGIPGTDVGSIFLLTLSICGDGRVTGRETCDVGMVGGGFGCNEFCVQEVGFVCSGEPSVCLPLCGDGLIVGNEQCDDLNAQPLDGCSIDCQIEAGFDCALASNNTFSTCFPICGDGLVIAPEECDDFNLEDGDGCNSNCRDEADNSLNNGEIAGIVLAVVFFFILMFAAFGGLLYTFKTRRPSNPTFNFNSNGKIHILKDIHIGKKIGSGHFGNVYKGTWEGKDVALKTIKGENLHELANELSIMGELKHPHVLDFYGIYEKGGDNYIVSEFMEKGDLLRTLRADYEMTISQMNHIVYHIASGMEHLHQNNIVHRDLAARNILVAVDDSDRYIAKIADFGLSRQVNEVYHSKSRKIPVRWTAPEALETGKFTSASDVWSFGVVMWEVYSRGSVPFAGQTNQAVSKGLIEGTTRLAIPADMPVDVGQIMKMCFDTAENRPMFSEIKINMDSIRKETHTTVDVARRVSSKDSASKERSSHQSVVILKERIEYLESILKRHNIEFDFPEDYIGYATDDDYHKLVRKPNDHHQIQTYQKDNPTGTSKINQNQMAFGKENTQNQTAYIKENTRDQASSTKDSETNCENETYIQESSHHPKKKRGPNSKSEYEEPASSTTEITENESHMHINCPDYDF